jgi:Fe-S-cluster-containing hydrogenase component 2
MSKEKQYWKVECHTCQTQVCLEIDEFSLISTDQAAPFIRKPSFVCGKCNRVCSVTLSVGE